MSYSLTLHAPKMSYAKQVILLTSDLTGLLCSSGVWQSAAVQSAGTWMLAVAKCAFPSRKALRDLDASRIAA